MRTADAIRHFGSQYALAKALKIKQPSVAKWNKYPPDVRQLQIERITQGKLKAEPECEARVLGLPLQRKTDRTDRKTARAQ
jgi:DNA-binding transcriptional regulator YdaS (Cro superfamily)